MDLDSCASLVLSSLLTDGVLAATEALASAAGYRMLLIGSNRTSLKVCTLLFRLVCGTALVMTMRSCCRDIESYLCRLGFSKELK